jgi:hypothetical protein
MWRYELLEKLSGNGRSRAMPVDMGMRHDADGLSDGPETNETSVSSRTYNDALGRQMEHIENI